MKIKPTFPIPTMKIRQIEYYIGFLNSTRWKVRCSLDPKAEAVNKVQRQLTPEPYFPEFFKSQALERENNLVNSRTRQVIERDSDEESVGTLVIDEDEDKDESILGNTSTKAFDKVNIWKESANLKVSIKK